VKTLLDREISDNDTMMKATGPVNMDLHPTKGYFMSTKKTMGVTDINGKNYMITIEEID
jgi:hypothetical protein